MKEVERPPKKIEPLEWQELEQLLQRVAKDEKPVRLKILNDLFRAVMKLAQDSPGTLNLKITSTVVKELRYSFKMFGPHRHVPKITMFGSARIAPDTPLYSFAKTFAASAVERGYMIITGGGPGIMAAGNEGAGVSGGFGLNIRLPFEQSANQFIGDENLLINYKYFFTRKLFLVKEAAAFAFFPGGFGTFDEAFEVLTLLQTGKTNLIPVVLLEPKGFGFWGPWKDFAKKVLIKKGFISPEDESLYRVFNNPEEALGHILLFYKKFHSLRFVKELAVIRLKSPISKNTLGELNKKFSALAQGGKYQLSKPLPEESNEPEIQDLPRLIFPCDRKDFGALRRLIDFINESGV